MLTAHKDNSPLETESVEQRTRATRSFDRVVNSIEGLRERVQTFTREQVSDAEQRIRTMSLQLSDLKRSVDALAEIKQRTSQLQRAMLRIKTESLEEQARLAALVEPTSVQSMAQIGVLLKFHRVLKILEQAKGGLPVTLATGDADHQVRVPPDPFRGPSGKPKSNEGTLATNSPAIFDKLFRNPVSEDAVSVTSVTPVQTERVFDSNDSNGPAVESPLNEPFPNRPADVVFDRSMAPMESAVTAEFDDTREMLPSSPEAIFEEFKGTTDMEAHGAVAQSEIVEINGQPDGFTREEADFDQRLLDDLIKNYGEFTILPRSTQNDESKELKPESPQVSASGPTKTTSPTNLPLTRKDGELDRKLKKLIKDYGEYDLYSRQTPINLKTGVVAAFLVLTLILSGFYFFSSTKSAGPLNAPATPVDSPSAGSKATTPNMETDSGETSSVPGPNLSVPKTVESEVSQNFATKTTTKKSK
jgi:hypothetical protein